MEKNISGKELWRELEEEVPSTRKCLERINEKLFSYKPHEKSMLMGYLALIVAEIPKWITITVKRGEIDLATWDQYKLTTGAELVKYFDRNLESAKRALESATDHELEEMFYLKSGEKELMKSSKKDNISASTRHLVHHRGQLTVYMRLNDILVPAIYGPSADDKSF